jgi:anaerobic selenocysteine-containing dehydrogenase
MGVVQASHGPLTPVSKELLSEVAIVCRLAKATLGTRSKVDWQQYEKHYDHIRNDIERTIPGFENYNQRVRLPGGFYLPNHTREGKFTAAPFNIAKHTPPQLQPGELLMMTIRSHDQFNTTIYGLDDRYRGIYNERRVILMNRHDIERHNLADGDVVDLCNYTGGTERVAYRFIVVAYPIPAGCTATYFPETNVLVPITSTALQSNTPTSKAVVIKLKKYSSSQ